MNTILKIGAATALSLGYVSAHAAIAVPTSYTPTTAVLFAEVLNSTGTGVGFYVGDTGVSLDSLTSGTRATGTLLAADSNLTSLLTLGQTAGDTVVWAVQGVQFAGQANDQTTQTAVTTSSANNSSQLASRNTGNFSNWAGGGGFTNTIVAINNLIGSGTSIYGAGASSIGGWDAAIFTSNASNWFSNGTLTAHTGTTTSANLYSLVGNANGSLTITSNGTVALSSAGLSYTASAVPLPAAIWLLGGGLLGLAGVSRRKTVAISA